MLCITYCRYTGFSLRRCGKAFCTPGRAGPPVELVASGGDRARTWATPSLVLYSIMSILKALTRPSLGPILNSQAACHQNHTASCPSPQSLQARSGGPGSDSPQLPALCALCPEIKERKDKSIMKERCVYVFCVCVLGPQPRGIPSLGLWSLQSCSHGNLQ